MVWVPFSRFVVQHDIVRPKPWLAWFTAYHDVFNKKNELRVGMDLDVLHKLLGFFIFNAQVVLPPSTMRPANGRRLAGMWPVVLRALGAGEQEKPSGKGVSVRQGPPRPTDGNCSKTNGRVDEWCLPYGLPNNYAAPWGRCTSSTTCAKSTHDWVSRDGVMRG